MLSHPPKPGAAMADELTSSTEYKLRYTEAKGRAPEVGAKSDMNQTIYLTFVSGPWLYVHALSSE